MGKTKKLPPGGLAEHVQAAGWETAVTAVHSQDSIVFGICQAPAPPVPIHAWNGKVVGRISGDTFHKVVRGSVHQLRRPPAWALDVQSLADAERLGARSVQITDAETGIVYTAPIALIRAKGFVFDRGHGRQIALPLAEWQVHRPGEPVAQQLPLGV